MSLPEELCLTQVADVVARTGLTEVGTPFRTLTSAQDASPVGQVRVFRGDGPVAKAVYVALQVPAIGLDSHMIFAFTRGDIAVPHFTLDSVASSAYHAFHLDLIPRAELASHLPYVDTVYTPLTDTFNEVRTWEGITVADIGPRQCAMMSPWMLARRATVDAFAKLNAPVATYRDHWYALLDKGLPDPVIADLADTELAARDARNRANLFSAEVDPVWHIVARLVGEQSEAVRLQLVDNQIGEPQ